MGERKYRRMTYTDRLIIEKLYNSGTSLRAIARKLGFAPSSIHREVRRGMYLHRDSDTWKDIPRYSATIADDNAKWQSTAKGPSLKLDMHHEYAAEISRRIQNGESPDAITGHLKSIGSWTVSTPTLYRYIDKGYIPGITNRNLIQKRSRKRKVHHVRASRPPAGKSIENRPPSVGERIHPGHWEMDTVIGKSAGQDQILLVLTERTTRFEIIRKLSHKSVDKVSKALQNITASYPDGTFSTITVDNGSEFSGYAALKQYANEIYYCHPYSSWERGSNENANRLIRRYLPKGTSFHKVTQADCDAIASNINAMHRKSLKYRTAQECFDEWQSTLV